jgi:hypothetical protein
MPDIRLYSPSGSYQLELSYAGEVRFGPPYFSVVAKGFSLDPSLSPVTEEILWSPSEKYLCLVVIRSAGQELLSELNVVSVSTGAGSLIERRKGQITVNSVDDNGEVEYVVRLSGNKVVKRA